MCAISQLPSAKNNPNVNVAYFWVAYSEPLRIRTRIERPRLGKLSAYSEAVRDGELKGCRSQGVVGLTPKS